MTVDGKAVAEKDARDAIVDGFRKQLGMDPNLPLTFIKYQRYVFFDLRTATSAIHSRTAKKEDAFPVTKSGFKITQVLAKYSATVTKVPYSHATNTPGVSEGIMSEADQVAVTDDIERQ